MQYIRLLEHVTSKDVALVGGKNAALGEMISSLASRGVRVPSGFAITADAYWLHLDENNLREKIATLLDGLDKQDTRDLQRVGREIRECIEGGVLPDILAREITESYAVLQERYGRDCSVAVRSSATAEDLPTASFAGQQETFLNVASSSHLLRATCKAFASLFTDRAISYRIDKQFDHMSVTLSIGVQKMVRSDLASSGVMFTIDTETGFDDVIVINSSYGLGESIVKGLVDPDEVYVHKQTLKAGFRPILKKSVGSKLQSCVFSKKKHEATTMVHVDERKQKRFSLTDDEILELAGYAITIEDHYTKLRGMPSPMDIEWAKDGDDGKIYIVQARPETVHSQSKQLRRQWYSINRDAAATAHIILEGKSVGKKIASGRVRCISNHSNMHTLKDGEVLVTDMTDPDWEPVMKRAGGIITNRGGRTCHAAIVSRELGIPAVIGTKTGTETLTNGDEVTLDCSRGERGYVYRGSVAFTVHERVVETPNELPVKLMVNIANPSEAFAHALLPVDGVGLARLEFIISRSIGIHPMALAHFDDLLDASLRKMIEEKIEGHTSAHAFFVDTLAQHVGTIAAAFYPRPVIVRLSDFKSNEYRAMIGGKLFEPLEENPMIGFRGASRYCHEGYKDAFALECQALCKIRREMGLTNVKIMIPFVRTVAEARGALQALAQNGLEKGRDGLEIIMMCEVPSNVILIDAFAELVDGFSIGSNDLTQLTLAVDRDSEQIAHIFDERDAAVVAMLKLALDGARRMKKPIGICGQAPSDYPEVADLLIKEGISSISLNADSVLETIDRLTA